jgi:hypothetical protein
MHDRYRCLLQDFILVSILYMRVELHHRNWVWVTNLIMVIVILMIILGLFIWGIVMDFVACTQTGCDSLYYLTNVQLIVITVQLGLRMCAFCSLFCAWCMSCLKPEPQEDYPPYSRRQIKKFKWLVLI